MCLQTLAFDVALSHSVGNSSLRATVDGLTMLTRENGIDASTWFPISSAFSPFLELSSMLRADWEHEGTFEFFTRRRVSTLRDYFRFRGAI